MKYEANLIPKRKKFNRTNPVENIEIDKDIYNRRLKSIQELYIEDINNAKTMNAIILRNPSFDLSENAQFKAKLTDIIIKENKDVLENIAIDEGVLSQLIFDSIVVNDNEKANIKVNQLIGFQKKEELYQISWENLKNIAYVDIPKLIFNTGMFVVDLYNNIDSAVSTGDVNVLNIVTCIISAALCIFSQATCEVDKKIIPILKLLLSNKEAYNGIDLEELKNQLMQLDEFNNKTEIDNVLDDMKNRKIIEISQDEKIITLKEKICFVN